MLPIDKVIGDTLVVWEDLFKSKTFKILKKPKFRLFGKWEIKTPEGDIIEYDKRIKIKDIIRDLEENGYINRSTFYIFSIDGFVFASSSTSGSWVKPADKPFWIKVSDDFYISRVLLVKKAYEVLRDKYPEAYLSALFKRIMMRVSSAPFIVYFHYLNGENSEKDTSMPRGQRLSDKTISEY